VVLRHVEELLAPIAGDREAARVGPKATGVGGHAAVLVVEMIREE
jgi:hypothetical protein